MSKNIETESTSGVKSLEVKSVLICRVMVSEQQNRFSQYQYIKNYRRVWMVKHDPMRDNVLLGRWDMRGPFYQVTVGRDGLMNFHRVRCYHDVFRRIKNNHLQAVGYFKEVAAYMGHICMNTTGIWISDVVDHIDRYQYPGDQLEKLIAEIGKPFNMNDPKSDLSDELDEADHIGSLTKPLEIGGIPNRQNFSIPMIDTSTNPVPMPTIDTGVRPVPMPTIDPSQQPLTGPSLSLALG